MTSRILLILSILILSTSHVLANTETIDVRKAEAFIQEMSQKHNFSVTELRELFDKTRYRDDIIQSITRPAEGTMPWYRYRNIFVKDARISGGVEFWKAHQDTLNRAEKIYGVPPEIIVAIIGVESRYGKHTGKYRVLDALATLAFYYPKRAKFFRSELEHFLLLSREESIDPDLPKGSYAGAMGQPQFIASSYRRYAVDFDGDGKRDLWNSMDDIIGSVANYFSKHHWKSGEPVTLRANITGTQYTALLEEGFKPKHPLKRLISMGVHPDQEIDENLPAALLSLEQKTGPEYWISLNNFYVITRYNHSPLYAMAAYQLAQEILKRKQAM